MSKKDYLLLAVKGCCVRAGQKAGGLSRALRHRARLGTASARAHAAIQESNPKSQRQTKADFKLLAVAPRHQVFTENPCAVLQTVPRLKRTLAVLQAAMQETASQARKIPFVFRVDIPHYYYKIYINQKE